MVLAATTLMLAATRTSQYALYTQSRIASFLGMPRATALAVMVLGLLILTTWRQLVQSLYVALSGRAWLARLNTAVVVIVVVVIIPVSDWVLTDDSLGAKAWSDFRWMLAALVCLKTSASVWAVIVLSRTRAVSDRALLLAAGAWCAAVLALHAALVWIVGIPHVPDYFLLMIPILALPFARIGAAPVALVHSRHG
jgi:hypothetical protein